VSAALELLGLECMRGQRLLFTGLSAAVPPGQLLRVQGENGAGKTVKSKRWPRMHSRPSSSRAALTGPLPTAPGG
jgi:ABC-type molybdenum transport system ATPase subunit/photorepair protein PhrA